MPAALGPARGLAARARRQGVRRFGPLLKPPVTGGGATAGLLPSQDGAAGVAGLMAGRVGTAVAAEATAGVRTGIRANAGVREAP